MNHHHEESLKTSDQVEAYQGTQLYYNGWHTLRKLSSNLYAPPPVALTVVTRAAMPLDLASARKFPISQVGKRMKCRVPLRCRIMTLSIYKKSMMSTCNCREQMHQLKNIYSVMKADETSNPPFCVSFIPSA